MLKGLRTAIYPVRDLAKAKAWYREVFTITPYFDEPFYVGFNVGGFELGLIPQEAGSTPLAGGVQTYWGVDDVDATFQRLLAHGATEHEKPNEVGGGIKVATVIDPFGNLLGVIFNPHFDPKSVK